MKSSWVKWTNYGTALSVITINVIFLLPVTIREINNSIPFADNSILMLTFNCNLLAIPAFISMLKNHSSYGGWLVANLISLLVCIYVSYLLVITVNAA